MSPLLLDRAGIAARIPHAGTMCLLAGVKSWSDDAIDCTATSHADPAHPLAIDGQLASIHAVEYAAQAMALHGALRAVCGDAAASRPGFIGALRAIRLHARRLDDIGGELMVRADRLLGDQSHAMYSFGVSGGGRLLVEGRISVAFGAVPVSGTLEGHA